MSRVLVTGGSGFIGAHCLLRLLAAGHEVRSTERDPARETTLRAMLSRGEAGDVGGRLTVFQADLNHDAGWSEATAGCDYVLHVASPFPSKAPRNENEVILPARDGTLRVMRAARDAGVKRLVLTSSFSAVGYGVEGHRGIFTEEDWADLQGEGIEPYTKSKTLAERAAWDFMTREAAGMELAVINPVNVLGPVLGADYSASILLVKRLMDGSLPGCPDLWFNIVDVRDVAELHVQAMTNPAARGERLLATAGDAMSMRQIAELLKGSPISAGHRVRTRPLPNWLMHLIGVVDGEVRGVLPQLGKHKDVSHAKATRLLSWVPRGPDEAVLATAGSLVELGLVMRKRPE